MSGMDWMGHNVDDPKYVDETTPLDTPVLVTLANGSQYATTTRSRAWVTPAGRLVVMVKGIPGAIECNRVSDRGRAKT